MRTHTGCSPFRVRTPKGFDARAHGMTAAGYAARCVRVPELPAMKVAVEIDWETPTVMTVSWSPYTAQSPDVVVTSYDVEMTIDNRKWTSVGSVAATTPVDHDGRYRYRVGRLVPGTRYQFRVVRNWSNGGRPLPSVPGPPSEWHRAHCGQYLLLLVFTSPLMYH